MDPTNPKTFIGIKGDTHIKHAVTKQSDTYRTLYELYELPLVFRK
jgi:hypothetical protein